MSDQNQTTEKLIFTQDEVAIIKDHLEDLKSHLFKTDFKAREFIDKNFSHETKKYLFCDTNLDVANSDLEQSIEKILKSLSTLEAIMVKTSFDPTEAFVRWLKDYLREQVKTGNGVVIKTAVDRSMVAGVMLEFRGKIKIQSAKEEILKVFSFSN